MKRQKHDEDVWDEGEEGSEAGRCVRCVAGCTMQQMTECGERTRSSAVNDLERYRLPTSDKSAEMVKRAESGRCRGCGGGGGTVGSGRRPCVTTPIGEISFASSIGDR
jgi:hypothetical protein